MCQTVEVLIRTDPESEVKPERVQMFVVFHRFSWFLENTAGESSPNFKLLQVWRLQKRMTSSNRIPMTKTYHLFLHRTFNSITFNKKPSVDFQSQTKWSNVRGLQRTLLTSPFTDQRSFLLLMFLLIWFILMWFFFPPSVYSSTHTHTHRGEFLKWVRIMKKVWFRFIWL